VKKCGKSIKEEIKICADFLMNVSFPTEEERKS
jgi:hypothetical protein